MVSICSTVLSLYIRQLLRCIKFSTFMSLFNHLWIKTSKDHRLNTELDLKVYLVSMCTVVLIGSQPPLAPIWAHIRGRFWSARIDDISLWPLLKTFSSPTFVSVIIVFFFTIIEHRKCRPNLLKLFLQAKDLVKIKIVFLKQFYTQGLDISLRDIYDKGNNVLAEFLYRDRDLAEEFLNRHISGQIYTR